MGLFSSNGKSETTKAEAELAQNNAGPETPTAATTTAKQEQPDLSPEDARKHAAVGKQLAAAFGELVTLLLRSEADRKRPIADLEWMIAPAIATGQFAVADAQSKKTGAISPIGAVLWAVVSDEVDKRLSDISDEQARLNPNEWRSGNVPWIVMAMGDKRVVAGLIKKLTQDIFKDQAPKIRSLDKDGKVVVGRVKTTEQPEASSQPKRADDV